MNLLILSVSAGAGHTQAAESIKKYTLMNNPNASVKIIDTLKYINPILDKVLIGSYLQSLKLTPSIFGKLYNFADNRESLVSLSSKFTQMINYKLVSLIQDFDPDVVVCTHPFTSEIASVLKEKEKINVPVAVILTDYAAHSFWLHDYIDAYVVSNNDMVEDLKSRGISGDIIHNLGIPVDPDFLRSFKKEETLNSINFDAHKKTLLLMGGSLGMGKIYDIYNDIQQIPSKIQLIIITGKNKKLYSQLIEEQSTSLKDTCIIEFTHEVNKYMQASDLLITKPGGLTITEAMICNLPMAIFSAIPGQEEKNADFLLKNSLAVSLETSKDFSFVIEKLVDNSSKLNLMKSNCKHFAKPNSGYQIYELLAKLSSK